MHTLLKNAAKTFLLSGEKLQGVGLRKRLHALLNESNTRGLAVNNPYTGNVHFTLNNNNPESLISQLNQYLIEKNLGAAEFTPTKTEKLKKISLSPQQLLNYGKFQQLKQDKLDNPEMLRQYIAKRYNLTPAENGGLSGHVTRMAKKQLFGKMPAYEEQINDPEAWRKASLLPNKTGMEKTAIFSSIVKGLGGSGLGKALGAARGAFKPFKSLGNTIPAGAYQAERQQALNAGNKFLQQFNPEGFHLYAGRVKTPESMLGNIAKGKEVGVGGDLLGFRVSPKGGNYSEENIASFADQLKAQGIDVTRIKKMLKPGYHGYNLSGNMPYAGSSVPVEFQITPRRLQGPSMLDHQFNYKPETSGVNPTVAKYLYRPANHYLFDVMSPMHSTAERLKSVGKGVGLIGAGAGSIYGASNTIKNRPQPIRADFNINSPEYGTKVVSR